MNKLLATLLMALLLTLCLSTNAHAADGTPLWTNVFNGVGNGANCGTSLAVDGSGNVYVTGQSYGGGSGVDYATIKYSSAGVPLWTNRFNGAGNSDDYATSLAVDGSGNVYVTGYSTGSGSGWDYATIKYSSAGVPLWTNIFNGAGNGNDLATAMAVDGSGNVYVTGYSTNSRSGYDYATIKYSSAGVPVWTNLFNGAGNGNDYARSLAVDGSGNVYVTGSTTGSGSGVDYATIKYSSAGVPLWTNLFNGAGNGDDYAASLAVDGSGNVYVTGNSTGSRSGWDYATIKYSSAGVPVWTNLFSGTGIGNCFGRSLAVDGSGNVYVTGNTSVNGCSNHYATIKYSSAGVPVWTNLFSSTGNGNDAAIALVVDGSGNVYVTGFTGNWFVNSVYATIKYSSAGVPVWTNLFSGTGIGPIEADSLAVDGRGNVYVTGYSIVSGSNTDYATIKYSGPPAIRFVTTGDNLGFTDQQFHFTLIGPAGSNAVISTSMDFQDWTPLATNPLIGGTLCFTDTLAMNFILRFYRANLQ